jgi:multidrug resistance efflux pump
VKILLGALATLLIALAWTTYRYSELKEEAGTWRHSIEEARVKVDECRTDVAAVKAQVEQNKADARERLSESRAAARRAQERTRVLEQELESLNEDIAVVSDQVVGDCPAITDPVYIHDILCAGPLGCTRS